MADARERPGLSSADALRIGSEAGSNTLPRPDQRRALQILVSQVATPLVLVLVAAAIVARMLGESIESVVILAIITLNAILGFFQEFRAERALRALQAYVSRTTRVWRDGTLQDLPASQLVPGDVVELEIGDLVPADLVVVHADQCTFDESSLTGESVPVLHQVGEAAFMGTILVGGEATGRVTAIGASTQLPRHHRWTEVAVSRAHPPVVREGRHLLTLTAKVATTRVHRACEIASDRA